MVETFNNREVELYIPCRAGDQIRATKVTVFKIGTGDLEINDIPDYTDLSKEIKGQNTLIIAEVREGMTEKDVFDRFVHGIKALEDAEDESNGWKTKGEAKCKGK